MRKRTKKYIPASRSSSRATSQQGQPPPCRGPETSWQGQTCSWLQKGGEEDGSRPAGLQSGKFNTGGTFSRGHLHACAHACAYTHAHTHPPLPWHRDWCGLPDLRPWKAPFPREQTLSLLLLEMESVLMPRENRSRPPHKSPGPTCWSLLLSCLPELGTSTGLRNLLGVPGGAEPQPRQEGPFRMESGTEAVPLTPLTSIR